MQLSYSPQLDEMRDKLIRQGQDTSLIDSIISLYVAMGTVGLDEANIDIENIKAAIENTQEAWHEVGGDGEPAFENSWANYEAGFNNAGFMKDSLGFVHLKGLIKNGSVGNPIFTLPAGYRPSASLMMTTQSHNGSAYVTARLDIYTSGNVQVQDVGGNGFVSLENITFKAA